MIPSCCIAYLYCNIDYLMLTGVERSDVAPRLGRCDPQANGLPARRQRERSHRLASLLCRVFTVILYVLLFTGYLLCFEGCQGSTVYMYFICTELLLMNLRLLLNKYFT